jgi:polar amino acid transport system substrate-binding protein
MKTLNEITNMLPRVYKLGYLLVAAAALASLVLSFGSPAESHAAQARNENDFLPSFWDPQHRIDKPDMAGVRVIRFITDDDFPPFHFALPDGTLSGFNIEIARALCDELKLTCTIQARRWDTLAESLNENRGDALIASLAMNTQTRAQFAFTNPYYTTPARFVMLTSAQIEDALPETLTGKTIGVEAGSAHEAFLKTFFQGATLKTYESQKALRKALKTGEVEILFGDGISLSFWLNGTDADKCCKFLGGPFTESRFFGEGVGIAVKKDNATLRRALDYALAKIAERGVYTDIYLKYFPVGFY